MAAINPTRVDTLARTSITWVLSAADTGTPIDVSDLEDFKGIQIVGGGTATIQVSNDGTNFATIPGTGAGVTTAGYSAPTLPTKSIQISAVATAAATVIISAQRHRWS